MKCSLGQVAIQSVYRHLWIWHATAASSSSDWVWLDWHRLSVLLKISPHMLWLLAIMVAVMSRALSHRGPWCRSYAPQLAEYLDFQFWVSHQAHSWSWEVSHIYLVLQTLKWSLAVFLHLREQREILIVILDQIFAYNFYRVCCSTMLVQRSMPFRWKSSFVSTDRSKQTQKSFK